MSRAKRDLGKLAGLLSVAAEAGQAAAPTRLPVAALRPGEGQPRREFDQAKLDQLTASVRDQGVLQPVLVRPVEGGYEIVAGERRWRASQQAGLTEIPVVVRNLSAQKARQLALIENLQREDLNMVDEVDAKLELAAAALGLTREQARQRLMQMLREPDSDERSQVETLFQSLGESWTSFAKNKLRILNWPPAVLEAVRAGLPFTLAAVIVSAPAEVHSKLLARAKAGASREELREALKQLVRTTEPKDAGDIDRLARVLASRKWRSQLTSDQHRAIEKWLSRMPEAVRQAISEQGGPG